MRAFAIVPFLAATLAFAGASADPRPKMIAYSATPNAYFNEHAVEVSQIYDGFFFTIGSWDEGVADNLGLSSEAPPTTDWASKAAENLRRLKQAGVTENLLAVHFGESAPWPSPETLRAPEYTQKMAAHFAALGKGAKALGFRGVSIDVEYPYPRYQLSHKVYTYDGYTADDLMAAAEAQGRTVMAALLDQFPEAVIFVLPGGLWGPPIERAFLLGMVAVMANRDAPGGFHLGSERAYGLLDPVAQVGIPRLGDLEARALLSGKSLDYWRRRCTVAPGVWPLHMVETGGKDYPVRPWPEELAELRQQMSILRTVAKRYIWSFSAHPVWYAYAPELADKYALPRQDFPGAAEALPGWHDILKTDTEIADPRILKLIAAVRRFDRGKIGPAELCSDFGTPGDWLILGPLGNPFTHPAYSAPSAAQRAVQLDEAVHGRDGVVRWFPFHNYDLLGQVRLKTAFDWGTTDDCSAVLDATVHAKKQTDASLWMGWDDGAVVRLNGQVVFDHAAYPERGHGMLFKDRYLFEEHVPITLPPGESRLTVTSINSHGNWGVVLRIADQDGFPLPGISFTLADQVK